jgi:hypothetical protein
MKKNEFAMMTARVNIDFISVLFRMGREWERERRVVAQPSGEMKNEG